MDQFRMDRRRERVADADALAERTRATAIRVVTLLAEAEERLARSPAQIIPGLPKN
jgi:hypothetical protein